MYGRAAQCRLGACLSRQWKIESVGRSWRFRPEGRLVVAWRRRAKIRQVSCVRCAKDVRGRSREDLFRVGGVQVETAARDRIRNRKRQNEKLVKEKRLEARTVVGSLGLLR